MLREQPLEQQVLEENWKMDFKKNLLFWGQLSADKKSFQRRNEASGSPYVAKANTEVKYFIQDVPNI